MVFGILINSWCDFTLLFTALALSFINVLKQLSSVASFHSLISALFTICWWLFGMLLVFCWSLPSVALAVVSWSGGSSSFIESWCYSMAAAAAVWLYCFLTDWTRLQMPVFCCVWIACFFPTQLQVCSLLSRALFLCWQFGYIRFSEILCFRLFVNILDFLLLFFFDKKLWMIDNIVEFYYSPMILFTIEFWNLFCRFLTHITVQPNCFHILILKTKTWNRIFEDFWIGMLSCVWGVSCRCHREHTGTLAFNCVLINNIQTFGCVLQRGFW